MNKKRKTIATISAVTASIAASVLILSKSPKTDPVLNFEGMPVAEQRQQFGYAWRSKAHTNRGDLIPYLLNAPASRGTIYSVDGTLLQDMSSNAVQMMLGNNARVYENEKLQIKTFSYRLGSIEDDMIGRFVPGIAKSDALWIDVDTVTDTVIKARTVN